MYEKMNVLSSNLPPKMREQSGRDPSGNLELVIKQSLAEVQWNPFIPFFVKLE